MTGRRLADPVGAIRTVLAAAASDRLDDNTVSTLRMLSDRRHLWMDGIEAIWMPGDECRTGMAELQAHCKHTVESAGPWTHQHMDPDLMKLHRRSAARGVLSRAIRAHIAPEVACTAASCLCHGEYYYGERPQIPLGLHLVDQAIVVLDVGGVAVVTSDRIAARHARAFVAAAQQTSRPVLPRDRRRDLRPTLRQLRILHLMSYGLTDEKIAAELTVTSRTVRNDVAGLYVMFEVQSRFELGAAYRGWFDGR
ncbi:LuxR C-terminal-related transcriptional regulator [Luteipulveratus sp. YIM 133132]|uniref:helix-turn-helix transcriptional regulator n=1 Tax=Luteipulveratus flavus TaxID=3031728 RepID=UPI0023B1420B|nr:LuxR C-terminal-related transcriptional regulator [Luteipulveratus sp. YIM 133132]MDE9365888.1 LuxR C-terminal-related transcriptional regulator [Luteipulveratus sp. YIM 133132]